MPQGPVQAAGKSECLCSVTQRGSEDASLDEAGLEAHSFTLLGALTPTAAASGMQKPHPPHASGNPESSAWKELLVWTSDPSREGQTLSAGAQQQVKSSRVS